MSHMTTEQAITRVDEQQAQWDHSPHGSALGTSVPRRLPFSRYVARMQNAFISVKGFAMRQGRRDLQHNLYRIAEGQGGYFTAAQAAVVGYGHPQQVYQRRSGAWEPIDHGLFRLRDFPPGEHEDLIRWSLWSRNRRGEIEAAVSHDTAADLYDFGDVMPARVHLTVSPGFRKPAPDGCVRTSPASRQSTSRRAAATGSPRHSAQPSTWRRRRSLRTT
jgi:hypothetical protein